jgi:rifampin ADP-ribosylating transferase
VIGDVVEWEGHAPDALQAMRDRLEELKRLGVEAIND